MNSQELIQSVSNFINKQELEYSKLEVKIEELTQSHEDLQNELSSAVIEKQMMADELLKIKSQLEKKKADSVCLESKTLTSLIKEFKEVQVIMEKLADKGGTYKEAIDEVVNEIKDSPSDVQAIEVEIEKQKEAIKEDVKKEEEEPIYIDEPVVVEDEPVEEPVVESKPSGSGAATFSAPAIGVPTSAPAKFSGPAIGVPAPPSDSKKKVNFQSKRNKPRRGRGR